MKIIHRALLIAATVFFHGANAAEAPVTPKDSFNRLLLKMTSEKLNQRESDRLGALYEQENQRQKDNRNSHTEYEFDGRVYHLELNNTTGVALNDLRIECRFFYTEKQVWRTIGSDAVKEQMCIGDSLNATLQPGEKVELTTKPFITTSWALPSGYYYKDGKAEQGKVTPDGLWVKVTYETPDGEELVRDFCEPKTLSTRVEWIDKPKLSKTDKQNNKKKGK